MLSNIDASGSKCEEREATCWVPAVSVAGHRRLNLRVRSMVLCLSLTIDHDRRFGRHSELDDTDIHCCQI